MGPPGPVPLEVVLDGEERRGRVMSRRMLEDVDMARVGWSGGTKTPSPRKDLTFDMRIRDDADGERRMIGSGRDEPFFEDGGPSPAEGVGRSADLLGAAFVAPVVVPARLLRPRKVSALLRTCEKSCVVC